MDSIFTKFVDLPLFRGVTCGEMSEVVGKAKFHFAKYAPGEKIVSAGAEHTELEFVFGGTVELSTENADRRFRVTQHLTSPDVIAPDFLFGRDTQYPYTVTAVDEVSIVSLNKTDYMDILLSNRLFLLNYLNVLSLGSQKAALGMLSMTEGGAGQRVAYWVDTLTQSRATDITIHCKLQDMCVILNVRLPELVDALDRMADGGMLTYDAQEININDRHAISRLVTIGNG